MIDLDAIRARLGSIAPSRMANLPGSVQRLLTEDLPLLLQQFSNCQECGDCIGVIKKPPAKSSPGGR